MMSRNNSTSFTTASLLLGVKRFQKGEDGHRFGSSDGVAVEDKLAVYLRGRKSGD